MKTSRLRLRMRRAGVLTLGVAMACGILIGTSGISSPSYAIVSDLPTWADVEAAKQDQAAGAAKVAEIEAFLVQVEAEVEKTKSELDEAGAALGKAEDELYQAQLRTETLNSKVEQSAKEADVAAEQAAALVSQLYRSGGVDRNVELFLESDENAADQLLDRLAQVEKATERNTSIADSASRAMNTAKTLEVQAQTATDERDRLRVEAEERKADASAAAAAASEKLAAQEAQRVLLGQQLEALKDTTTTTTQGYQERVRLEKEEQLRLEEEARKKAEEEAAAGGGGGGSTGGGGGGQVSGNWRVPLNNYYVSDWWGAGRNHTGVDLAAGGGTPIYAASSGTVTMAGWYSPCYGYMVEISHGGGVATRYAHQVQQPVVGYGQWVNTGQIIGYVGTTGCSYGNHLHFEVYTWGYPINPAPFFAARGLYF